MNFTTPIILASKSPRRQQLMTELEINFEVMPSPALEAWPPEMPALEVAEYLARLKAQALVDQGVERLIIAADTVVIWEDKVLGKPVDHNEAKAMLQALSGHTHQVVTGVCLQQMQRIESFHAVTQVEFHSIRDEEIEHYLQVYKPFDKAGAYGIQEWIGMIGVKSIQGSFYNVMGLPVDKVYQALKRF